MLRVVTKLSNFNFELCSLFNNICLDYNSLRLGAVPFNSQVRFLVFKKFDIASRGTTLPSGYQSFLRIALIHAMNQTIDIRRHRLTNSLLNS